nr:unnamed protein product [Digitaria exilis]
MLVRHRGSERALAMVMVSVCEGVPICRCCATLRLRRPDADESNRCWAAGDGGDSCSASGFTGARRPIAVVPWLTMHSHR